jgi:hypothetical protein
MGIIGTSALQLCASRCLFASGELAAGSRHGNDSRQNALAAYELSVRERQAGGGEIDSSTALVINLNATRDGDPMPGADAHADTEDRDTSAAVTITNSIGDSHEQEK